ncbi:MAG TPA: hypothetical protein VI792_09470 [Candidatus Eisenbacteria bacterium]
MPVLLLAVARGPGAASAAAAPAAKAVRFEPAPALLPPLDRMPLSPPLRITGSFGELRGGHFHGGIDLSTGGVTGKPVYAALTGAIERIRTSGVGYGRSLYLRARDGRLLVMGHLDQFARPIAKYVAAIQDSTGRYEQDLWPEPAQFPVTAGQVVAWSGRSGTLPPHLHFEVRRGDVAYNPLRAGITLADSIAPAIERLTLEPLDDTSFVDRSAAPRTVALGAAPDTFVLQGRARAIVEATDGTDGARLTLAPWSLTLEPEAEGGAGLPRVECRFDSASWAGDMAGVDYVYDHGRITDAGRFSMMLWAPREFRPVVIAGGPGGEAIGTLALGRGERERTMRLVARDVAGHATVRTFVLRAPAPVERGPIGVTLPASKPRAKPARAPGDPPAEGPAGGRFEFVSLPERHLRVVYLGAPPGSRGVWFESARTPRQAASASGDAWTAILPASVAGPGGPPTLTLRVGGEDARGSAWSAESPAYTIVTLDPDAACGTPPGVAPAWRLPRGGAFESALALIAPGKAASTAAGELVPVGEPVALLPASLPLHRPAVVSLPLPPGAPEAHVGLFVDSGDGWEWVGGERDSVARGIGGERRSVGAFALFEDTRGPSITLRRAPRHAATKPYSHWALEATLADGGSGVDAAATHFVVDGRVVPSEWDESVGILRWRPLRRPAPGHHRYEVVAADRAGNVTRRGATLVID